MKSIDFNLSVRNALMVAVAALLTAMTPTLGAAMGSSPESAHEGGMPQSNSTDEAGTIPAARPGLPQQPPSGAAGPIREDYMVRPDGDPSIRDSNPLTINGLWETQPGNRVTKPEAQ